METLAELETKLAAYRENIAAEERQIREAKSRLNYNLLKLRDTVKKYERMVKERWK